MTAAESKRAGRKLPPLPKVLGSNGKRPCRGCGAKVPKGRQTWCSKGCAERHYMALSFYARHKVFARDKGICAQCGTDTEFLARIRWHLKSRDDVESMRALKEAWGLRITPWGTWEVPNLWEADHIVPLAEGGTNALDNYRTLCIPCHKEATKALAARLAAARREAKGEAAIEDRGMRLPL